MKKIIQIKNTAVVAGTGLALVAFAALISTNKAWAATGSSSVSLQNAALTQAQIDRLASRYSYVDPEGMVPSDLLIKALAFFDANKTKLGNRQALAVVNNSHLGKTLFVVNMQSGHAQGYDLTDSTQSMNGYYLADETISNHRLAVKINSIQSGRVSATSALLRGMSSADQDAVARALQGGSLLYAGQSDEEDQLMQATAVSSSSYTVQTPPLWEAKRKTDGRAWTLFSFDVVKNYGTSLMAGTSDIRTFCPSYSKLTQNQKLNFWVYLVSAVVKYESAFNPLSRYHESTMGTDAITKKPVYSEGLMQLSYQDIQGYPFCEFNWSVDRYLSPTDPKKTILDPYKNLKCGIRILNQIVKKKGLIAFNTGHYWSTLQPKNSTEKSIVALTNTIPFCKK